jgi:hypothetical protein
MEERERRLTMEVEFTARQVKISKALRTHAEEGMERIGLILGKSAHASITFSAQRHVQIVELTVQGRAQKIAATGKADHAGRGAEGSDGPRGEPGAAFRDRRMGSKRLPKEEKVLTAPPGIPAQGARHAAAGRGREEKPEPRQSRARRSRFTLSRRAQRWLSRTF